MNPFAALLRSRKFWLAFLDAFVSTVGLLATRYLSPDDTELVLKLVAIYQPVIVVIIGAIAYEDAHLSV